MKNSAGSLFVLDILFLFSFFFQDIQKGESVFLLSQVYFGRTHLSFRKQALASKKKMAMSTAMVPDVDKMAAGSIIPNKSCLNNACRFRNGMRKYDKSNWFGALLKMKNIGNTGKKTTRDI